MDTDRLYHLRLWAKRPDDKKFTPYVSPTDRVTRIRASQEVRAAMEDAVANVSLPGKYWRATNRRGEYDDVMAGVDIKSTNHADHTPERGMSVCERLAYACLHGYRYCYRVDGDVIGEGSDGEPLLVNVRTCSPLQYTAKAAAPDPEREAETEALMTICQRLSIKCEELLQLVYTDWR